MHHENTPLHLAFSCYVFDESGRLLITQRALDKPTFPGVWTNSVCGHPAPGEDLADAVHRRARAGARDQPARPDRRAAGLPLRRDDAQRRARERDLPRLHRRHQRRARQSTRPRSPQLEWVDWAAFRDEVLAGQRAVSMWCAAQVAEMAP